MLKFPAPLSARLRLVRLTGIAVLVAILAGTGLARAQVYKVPGSQDEVRLTFAPVVKAAAPAVVNVYATRKVRQQNSLPGLFDDPFFRRFFDAPNFGAPRERVQNALGSGVIVDEAGLIVTNNHVVQGADEVRVVLSDRREFAAAIVLKDERTDLAVLRIENSPRDLPHITFASADALQVGDLVLAIGNPFGVGQTVTSGIVSAVARTQAGINDMGFFIQTDAAINPGNSGGALVDMQGRLVGINTAIFSRSGGSIGIGFAIPSEMVQIVVASAETGAEVRRPWFGGEVQAVTGEIAQTMGLERPVGVLVTRITEDGPAARAGLKVGDVITSVNGREIADPAGFKYRFLTRGIGGTADLKVLRGGRERTMSIELAAAPETRPRNERVISAASPFAGVKVANLSPAVAEELGLTGNEDGGVAIVDIARNSPAARAGFRPGDIVLSVNGVSIDSTATLDKVASSGARLWRLRIERGGRVSQMIFSG